MTKFKMSPPWEEYINKVKCLFEFDPDVVVESNGTTMKIFVDGVDKYEAFCNLFPDSVSFGNVILTIVIVPANKEVKNASYYLKNMFKGNTAVTDITDIDFGTNTMTFIEFRKDVVQYYNDNIGDLHGNRTTVREEIAREVFEGRDGVFFCTSNT